MADSEMEPSSKAPALPEHMDVETRIFRDDKGVIYVLSPLFTDYVSVSFDLVKTQKVDNMNDEYEDVPGSDKERFEFYCPRQLAEAMIADVALKGIAPWAVVIELAQRELLALDETDFSGREKLQEKIKEMNRFRRRTVGARILDSQAVSKPGLTPEEARVRDAAIPDFETYEEAEARKAVEAASPKGSLPVSAFRLKNSSRTLM